MEWGGVAKPDMMTHTVSAALDEVFPSPNLSPFAREIA